MFGFEKKITEKEAKKLFQQQMEETLRKNQEEEEGINKIERYYINKLKKHLEHLPVDILNIIFSQAVFNMCYESFLQAKHSSETTITMDCSESNYASYNAKLVLEKYRYLDRKLKGQFHFYMMKACQELISKRKNENEETSGS